MSTIDLTDTNRLQVLKGSLFRYVCFLATSVGLLSLAALLGIVTWDAFGFNEAALEWIAIVAVSLLCTIAAVIHRSQRDRAFEAATLESTAAVLGGAILGTFAVVFLIIATPTVWFAYAAGAILPCVVAFRLTAGHRWRVPITGGTFLAGILLATLALEQLTAAVSGVDPWLLYFGTLVVPFAAFLTERVARSESTARGLFAGGLVAGFGLAVAVSVPAPEPLHSGLPLVFAVCLAVPTGVVVWRRLRESEGVAGIASPFAIAASVAVGALVAGLLGFAGPEPWLDWQFLTSTHSRHPENAGLYPAIIGSFFLMIVMSIFAFPVSVGAAIYLEEYAPSSGWRGRIVQLIQVNIANLAGVPSVVYGLLGLAIIANGATIGPLELWGGLGVGAVMTASFTIGLLIMPITIISAQEAIRAVPDDHRQASYAMGASDWHTLRNVVLPEALPGIFTGTILSLGRAIGETAPLIMVGAATTVFSPPTSLGDDATAMPMQIFAWAGEFIAEFRTGVLSTGVLVLLLAMLSMNAVAILLRNRYERNQA